MDKFAQIRSHYPGAAAQVYLDTSTSGLLSDETYEAAKAVLDKRHLEGVSIPEYWDSWAHADSLRPLVAQLIGAAAEEVFFGKDCSDILNIFTVNMQFQRGQKVLVPDVSFPSTRNTWLNREADGLAVQYLPAKEGVVTTQQIIDALADDVFAVSVCAVEHSTGYRYDLAALGKACRQRGIYLVVDATQCLGGMAMDMEKMQIDFMAASTYKWLNNVFGVGVGYVRKDLVPLMKNMHMGWGGIGDRMKDSANLTLTMHPAARRFETGGLNWLGLKGLEQAVKTVLALGKEDTEKYILERMAQFYEGAKTLTKWRIAPALEEGNRSGIVYLNHDESVQLSYEIMARHGVRINIAGPTRVRIGIHFYNNPEDVEKCLAFLKALE